MTRRILVIGAGGHGKVVADALLQAGQHILGFLDDDPAKLGTTCLGLPVLGPIRDFGRHAPDGLVLGIGANSARRKLVEALGQAAAPLWCNTIHPHSVIAPSATLGRGLVVAAGAIINPDVHIGDHAIINTAATVDHDCTIGNYAHVAPGTHLAGDVHVGEGALLGTGVTVIPSRRVGAWSIVGAGAVVIRDVPGQCTVVGIPAKIIESARHKR